MPPLKKEETVLKNKEKTIGARVNDWNEKHKVKKILAKRMAGIECNEEWQSYDDVSDDTWEYKKDLKQKLLKL